MAARATRLSDLGLTARAGRDPALSGLTADSRAVSLLLPLRELPTSPGFPQVETAPLKAD